MTLKNTYNDIAQDYYKADLPKVDWLKSVTVQEFFKRLKKGARALDVGCGPGNKTKELIQRGYKVTGIDFSESMIEIARRRIRVGEFQVMDITRIGFPPSSFDAAVALASLIHVRRSKIQKVLKDVYKILDEGGLLFATLKKGRGNIILRENYYNKKTLERLFVLYKLDDLTKLLKEAGFIVVHACELPGRTHTWIHVLAQKM